MEVGKEKRPGGGILYLRGEFQLKDIRLGKTKERIE
jgi:hypothetical protein